MQSYRRRTVSAASWPRSWAARRRLPGKISGKSLGSALVGSLTKVVVAAGIGKMLQSAFTGGTAFEECPWLRSGTIADTGKVPLESLSSQVLQVSGDMHIGANEIAEAAYQTISAGQDTGNAVAFAGRRPCWQRQALRPAPRRWTS